MAKKNNNSYKNKGGRKVKGENIKIIKKDIYFLRDLNNTGRMQEHHLKEHNIPPSRASKMVWDGYIEKKDDKDGNPTWNITSEGREVLARETGEEVYAYKAQGMNSRYYHDLKLADLNSELTREERDTWMNESQLRNMWEQHLQEVKSEKPEEFLRLSELNVSPPDGAYITSDGTIQAVEVISRWYTEEMIEAKITFCQEMNMSFQGYRC